MAQIWGAFALRLADDPVIPLNFVDYAASLERYASTIKSRAKAADAAAVAAGQTSVAFPFGYLDSSIATFRRAALAVQARSDSLKAVMEEQGALAAALSDGAVEPPHMIRQLRTLNDALMLAERAFIIPEGLPGRAWFKHAIFSPGKHNTYAAEKFPGVSDALSEGKLSLAVAQLHAVCRAIVAAADTLDPPALDGSRAGRDEL